MKILQFKAEVSWVKDCSGSLRLGEVRYGLVVYGKEWTGLASYGMLRNMVLRDQMVEWNGKPWWDRVGYELVWKGELRFGLVSNIPERFAKVRWDLVFYVTVRSF